MAQLLLRHLTFVGAGVEPASVDFGRRVTVVRGPSDTGKSFVLNAIDFMLGAKTLKEIPERDGYSTVLLGLELPDGGHVTLSRRAQGGNFGLHLEDVRDLPIPDPSQVLSATHSGTTETNLSRYLLRELELDDRRVRKNVHNKTDSLSFRNLAHLVIVDETKMQADTAPALTGSYTTKTKEISVLKMLLQDEDDSGLLEAVPPQDARKLSNAKIDVIDRLIADIESRLSDTPEPIELRKQLGRLSASIDQISGAISDILERRSDAAKRLSAVREREATAVNQLSETRALQARFQLLDQQYASDIERLEMVAEAGNLLGYFKAGVCVFCGAEPAHQQINQDCLSQDSTGFREAVLRQSRETATLRNDLAAALQDLTGSSSDLHRTIADSGWTSNELKREISDLDRDLAQVESNLRPLNDKRSSVESLLALHEQIAALEKMKMVVADEAQAGSVAAAAGIKRQAEREFSKSLEARLAAWDFPDPNTVRYSTSAQDVIAGDQTRSAHGKGVRSILHAAFSIGLADYCLERDIPHPGFLILDSPLVTYRPPDAIESAGDRVSTGVAAAFYRDIQQNFDGQIVVIENTNPPEQLKPDTTDIQFTKVDGFGRYGFFPYASND